MTSEEPEPLVVTFKTGAEELVKRKIVDNITERGVRYIAATHEEWPFGEGRTYPYGKASNARTMATQPFLRFFREHPPSGRGPAKKPRPGADESE